MSQYTEFFLNSRSSSVQLETLSVYHPDFSKTYHIVINAANGLTVIENGEKVFYEYYPAKITPEASRVDLDFGIKVQLGDIENVLQTEISNVLSNNNESVKPKVTYRIYQHFGAVSADIIDAPIYGPIELEVKTFSFTNRGAVFTAQSQSVNVNGTGEVYTIDRFPMLRGYL